MADADNYTSSSGGSGGNDWELVSLTVSTYAAAPGPILPLLQVPDHDKKRESQSPPPAPAIFMSQHFNLPAEAHTDLTAYDEFTPLMVDDDTDLNMPCAKDCETGLDDGLTRSDYWDEHKSVPTLVDVLFADGNGLQGGGRLRLAGEERQTTVFCSLDAADAATDAIIDSAGLSCLTADVPVAPVAISSGVACIAAKDQSKIPCEAWWKKTFSFLCSNAKESLTFRFIFVAATIVGLAILGQRDKLQLQQLRLEFNVDGEVMEVGGVWRLLSDRVGYPSGSIISFVVLVLLM